MKEKEKFFIEYTFEGIEITHWKDFVNKWKLKILTDDITKNCAAYNENCTICITGVSNFHLTDDFKKEDPLIERADIDQPSDNISLIMNDKIETKTMLSFLNDFNNLIEYVDDIDFNIHKNEIKNIIHPDWILKKMMQDNNEK